MNWLLSLLQSLLTPILAPLDSALKAELASFIQALYTKAKATSSPLDDLAIKVLADILNITVE
jgi:hypothetical protein